ncbi:hypothetical protein, partial [Lacticaseibacillus rhamnosus]|uniref:hypothetical protein n=1 Tax=Lacticaseibacillus rhamnosus TaxID=47715 RepID=UPI001EE11FA5
HSGNQYGKRDDNRRHVQYGETLSSPDFGMAITSAFKECCGVCAIQSAKQITRGIKPCSEPYNSLKIFALTVNELAN